MARITTSGLIGDIDGKIKGSVFQKNSSGIILRNQPAPIIRKTSLQVQQKTGNQYCQQLYSQLSQSQIQAWKAYALFRMVPHKKNVGLFISGQQLFLKENMLRYTMSKSVANITPLVIQDPTIGNPPDTINIVTLTNTGTQLNAFLTSAINSTASFLCIKMSKPLSASQESQYNKLAVMHFNQITSDTQDLKTAYESVYSRMPNTGEWINYTISRGLCTDNGISSELRGRLQVL